MVMPKARILEIVVVVLIDPSGEETPAKCKLDIADSTAAEEWLCKALNGGYTVHPVPPPTSTKLLQANNVNAGGSSQKEILFSLGNQDFPFHF
jgi:hypothetical protein